jgi:hypothetical protein
MWLAVFLVGRRAANWIADRREPPRS